MRTRRVVLAGVTAAVIAAAALAGYWMWAATQVRTAIAEWADAQRAAGYQVAYDGPEIGGFPVRLMVRLGAPRIAAPQGWRWSGAAIAGEAEFWRPLSLHLDLPLRQELAAIWRGQARVVTVQATRAEGLVRLDRRGQAVAATVEMTDVTLREAAGLSAHVGHMRHAITRPAAAPDGEPRTHLEGTMADLTLAQMPPPFPATIDRLAYAADLIGDLPPGAPAAALAAWRDGGGLVQVTNLTLLWGPLDVRADGTLALDSALRPQGAFSAHIAGLPELLDVLVAQGMITPGAAAAFRIAVLTLSEGRDGSGRPTVRLPVTVQDGTLFLGPLALAQVDPVL